MPSLSTLPTEILLHISDELPLDFLCSLRATNRRFCDALTPCYVSRLYAARDDSEEYVNPPLHNAGKQGNLPLTLLLIRHGADVSERAAYILYEDDFETEIPEVGPTPLHACARGSDPNVAAEIARVLLQAGAEVNKVEQSSGQTPLHAATQQPKGMLPFVKLLIECGADINARDKGGQTPLHNCANCDCDGLEDALAIAKLLVEADAEADARSADGATPLQMCAAKLKRRLVEAGAAEVVLQSPPKEVAGGGVGWWSGIAEVEGRAELAMLKFLVERGAVVDVE
jgi:hypothetical protein